jgi:hypothetical protein
MAALSTALLIGAGIAGGTSLASAAIGSHAAGKASDQQQESADKALALQQQMYQQQRADVAPWRNAGGQAVTTLSGLMGLPAGPAAGQTEPVSPADQRSAQLAAFGPGVGAVLGRWNRGQPYSADVLGGMAPGRQAQLRSLDPGGFAQTPEQLAGVGQAVGQAQTSSGYATMQSPDGKETQQVPVDQVAHYQQMGARRIG